MEGDGPAAWHEGLSLCTHHQGGPRPHRSPHPGTHQNPNTTLCSAPWFHRGIENEPRNLKERKKIHRKCPHQFDCINSLFLFTASYMHYKRGWEQRDW